MYISVFKHKFKSLVTIKTKTHHVHIIVYEVFFQIILYSHLKFYPQQHLVLLKDYGKNMLIVCSSAVPLLINEMRHNLIDHFIPHPLYHFHNCFAITNSVVWN